jgi:hypothetical protein
MTEKKVRITFSGVDQDVEDLETSHENKDRSFIYKKSSRLTGVLTGETKKSPHSSDTLYAIRFHNDPVNDRIWWIYDDEFEEIKSNEGN